MCLVWFVRDHLNLAWERYSKEHKKRTEQSYILLLYYWKIIFNLQLNDHVCCSPQKRCRDQKALFNISEKKQIPFVLTSIIDLTLILVWFAHFSPAGRIGVYIWYATCKKLKLNGMLLIGPVRGCSSSGHARHRERERGIDEPVPLLQS